MSRTDRPPYRPRSLRVTFVVALFALLGGVAAAADKAPPDDPSLWDKARNGTARVVKATGNAVQRAATKTEQFLTRKDVQQKTQKAVDKTSAKIDGAVEKANAVATTASTLKQSTAKPKPAPTDEGFGAPTN